VTPISIAPTLPDRWNEIRFRYVAATFKGRLPTKGDEDATDTGSLPYLSMEYLRGDSSASTYVSSEGMVTAENQDVLLLWDGSNAGEFLRAKYGAVSSTAALVSPFQFDRKFLFWLCKAAEPVLKTFTNGMGIPHVDGEFLKNLVLPYPKETEDQERIANYLDRETAHIDGLIAEKEHMLALLEEKRAALISRVVTRGLDPNAPLKPSGQEWLGEIPAHWHLLRLKFAISGIDQGSSPQCYSYPAEPGEWGVLKTGCVNGGEFRERENKALPDETEAFLDSEVHQGDVLMSRASGSVDLIGSVAHVSRQPAARLLLSDKIYRFRVRDDVLNPRFMVFAMGAGYLRYQIKSVISGAEGLANNITKSDIMELLLVVPSVPEQEQICAHLERAINSNKVLCDSLCESISLAKERRAALITAAVTGQIPLEAMRG